MAYYDLMTVTENLRQARELVDSLEFGGRPDPVAESLAAAVGLMLKAVEELAEAMKETMRCE